MLSRLVAASAAKPSPCRHMSACLAGRSWRRLPCRPAQPCSRRVWVTASMSTEEVEDPYVLFESDPEQVKEIKQMCVQERDELESEYRGLQEKLAAATADLQSIPNEGVLGWASSKLAAAFRSEAEKADREFERQQAERRAGHLRIVQEAYRLSDPEYVNSKVEAQVSEAMQDLARVGEQLSTPGAQAALSIGVGLTTAAIVTGVGGLLGLKATQQLVLPPGATWETLGLDFCLWTAPFVAATALFYALLPAGSKQSVVRGGLSNDTILALPAPALPALALGLSFAECVTYQGMWQRAVFGYFGAPASSVAAVEDLLQPAIAAPTGALVMPQVLPYVIVVPLAAAGVGALEGACSTFFRWMNDSVAGAEISIADDQLDIAIDWRGDEVALLTGQLGEQPREGLGDPLTGTAGPGAVALPEGPSERDLWLHGTRVALSGAWLAAETALTGSLWLAVATSTFGVLAATAAVGRRGPKSSRSPS